MDKKILSETTSRVYKNIQELKLVHKQNLITLAKEIFKNTDERRWVKIEMTGLCRVTKLEINPALLKKDIKVINEKISLALKDVFNQVNRNYVELGSDVLQETFGNEFEKYWYR